MTAVMRSMIADTHLLVILKNMHMICQQTNRIGLMIKLVAL